VESHIAADIDFGKVDGPKPALMYQSNMVHTQGVKIDDLATHGVKSDLVVPHDNQVHFIGNRGQHATFARNNRVDGDELRLNDVLEVGNLLIKFVVVVDESVSVVLNADIRLQTEGDR